MRALYASSIFLSVLAVFIFTSGGHAVAQQSTTEISVTPAIVDVAISPGETQNRQVTIRNSNDYAIPISFEVQQLISNDDIFDDTSSLSDASNWVSIRDPTLLFGKGDAKKVAITIDVPKDASPGGHYAQVSVRALTLEQNNSGESSIVIPEITISVFITVAGDIVEDFEFSKGIDMQIFARPGSENPLNFSIRNVGNTHGLMTPVLFITDKNDQIVVEKQLTVRLVLPGTEKKFQEIWKAPDEYGRYKAHLEFRVGGTNNIVASPERTLIVSHSLVTFFLVGLTTIVSIHIARNRKNVKGAVRVLFGIYK